MDLRPESGQRTGATTIRVAVVHSVPLVAESLRIALRQERDLEVVGVHTGAILSVESISAQHPDIVLLEAVPDVLGLIVALQEADRPPRVIVIAAHEDIDSLAAWVTAGAMGCLTGPDVLHMLSRTIRHVFEGWVLLTPDQLADLLNRQRMSTVDPVVVERWASLSAREREVLQALTAGSTTYRTARHLGISVHTLRSHLVNAMRKLQVSSNLAAVLVALRVGIVGPQID